MDSPDAPKTYAVRLTDTARADIENHHDRIASISGTSIADDWEDGLFEAMSHLATSALRPLAMESALFKQEVRSLLYRRKGSQAAYRILFCVRDKAPDSPAVVIFHIRHASAGPLHEYEARNLMTDIEDVH